MYTSSGNKCLSDCSLCKEFLSFFPSLLLSLYIANLICSYRVSCACQPSVLSIPNGISRTVRDTAVVRIMLPSSFSFWFRVGSPPCDRSASALVVFVIYSKLFRHQFIIIRLLSFKIHIRYSYEKHYSFFSVISVKIIGNDLFRINRGTTVLCTVQ